MSATALKFIPFTTVDNQSVWIVPEHVTAVIEQTNGCAIVTINNIMYTVKDDVEDALRLLKGKASS